MISGMGARDPGSRADSNAGAMGFRIYITAIGTS
jgi:hypothetical protein